MQLNFVNNDAEETSLDLTRLDFILYLEENLPEIGLERGETLDGERLREIMTGLEIAQAGQFKIFDADDQGRRYGAGPGAAGFRTLSAGFLGFEDLTQAEFS